MKGELTGICAIRCVTVHAIAIYKLVLDDRCLFEVAEIALVEAHHAVGLVAGRNQTVGNTPLAQGIATNVDRERLVFCPLSVFSGGNCDFQTVAAVLLDQRVPLIEFEVGVRPVGMKRFAVRTPDHDIQQIHIVVIDVEIQRGDIGGDGNTCIIRRNLRP